MNPCYVTLRVQSSTCSPASSGGRDMPTPTSAWISPMTRVRTDHTASISLGKLIKIWLSNIETNISLGLSCWHASCCLHSVTIVVRQASKVEFLLWMTSIGLMFQISCDFNVWFMFCGHCAIFLILWYILPRYDGTNSIYIYPAPFYDFGTLNIQSRWWYTCNTM